MPPHKDKVGQAFGRLKVISRAPSDRWRQTFWNCECSCGNLSVVRGHALTSGHTRSCGCLQREVAVSTGASRRKQSIYDSTVNDMFLLSKRGASNRGLEFSISKYEFISVASMPCTYCGCLPKEAGYRTTRKKVRIPSGVFAHGVDREDNSIGYVIENIVPCCWECNRSKATLTVDEFKSLIARQHAFMFNKSKEIYMGLDTQDVSYMEAA